MAKKKKPRCSVCGSKRFHRDGQTGRIVCDEGHLLQDYIYESQEREVNTAGLRLRKLRKQRKKKVKAAATTFKGERARFLMFEAAQLLLRQQIQSLISLWNLPPELETVARDLWIIYVSCTDLGPEPHFVQPEAAEPSSKSKGKQRERQDGDIDSLFHTSDEDDDPDSDQDEDEDDDDDNDPAAKKLEKDAQKAAEEEEELRVWHSQPAGPTRAQIRQSGTKVVDLSKTFHAHFTLVICYLACLQLRIPVFMHDILEAAVLGQIPFIAYADRLPNNMRNVMTHAVVLALSPPNVPQIHSDRHHLSFEYWIAQFMTLYSEHNVSFPPVNVVPLLARCVRRLLLPPPFFFAAKRLLNQLDINFGFKSEAEERNRKRSAQTNTLFMRPDALLGAAVVVCTKHTWGLDGDIRHAHPKQDGAANEVPRSRAWVKALEQQEQMPKTQSQSELTRKHPLEMEDEEMDAFLDHCQSSLIIEDEQNSHMSKVASRFPLREPSGVSASSTSSEAASILEKLHEPRNRIVADDSHLLSAEDIPYDGKTPNLLASSKAYATVLNRIAGLLGYRPIYLAKCVRELDLRVIKLQRRKEREGANAKQAETQALLGSRDVADEPDDWVDDSDDEAETPVFIRPEETAQSFR